MTRDTQSLKPKAPIPPTVQSPEPKAQLIAARRRYFFASCKAQALDEETQSLIAIRFIPDNHPDKWDRQTGAISRKAIFSDSNIFAEVMHHLAGTQRKGRKDLKGSGDLASRAMYGRAFKLARQLGWDEHGNEDLRLRLQKFATRQLSSSSGIAYLFEALTSAQMMRVVEGLKGILAGREKAGRSLSTKNKAPVGAVS